MARNKYPEETVKRILDVAESLFTQKGYERTSLQDIINETKLSKGAIYHHFASKEEILIRIFERFGQESAGFLIQVRDSRELNGREKLKKLFQTSLLSQSQERMLSLAPYLLDNPKFLVLEMKSIYSEVVPDYIQPILEEGIADGSIRQTTHPKELAEALLMLTDIWLNPLLQPTTPEEIRRRCEVFNQLTGTFGLELLDEELIETLIRFSQMQARQK